MTDGGRGTGPRSLAEDLRARDDAALALLLRARPDLLAPVPPDLTQLATRASTRSSVLRALDRLDRFTHQVAEALAVAPDPCPYEDLRALMTGTGVLAVTIAEPAAALAESDARDTAAAAVLARPAVPAGPLPAELAEAVAEGLPQAVHTLRVRGIVWGDEETLHLVRTARDLLAPSAGGGSGTGLGPSVGEATAGMSPARLQEIVADAGLPATHDPTSAVQALGELFTDASRLADLLAEAPEGVPGVLDRLVWGPPYGEVRDAGAAIRAADATTPVQWLLARGLLLPAGAHTVLLPREAALALRGGRAHRTPEPSPPAMTPVERPERTVDRTAAGQAFTAVRTVSELLAEWQTGGPPVLRAGGLSVRDLKRTAAALDLPEPETAFWLELAYGAGLIATDGEVDEAYAPTPTADEWLQAPAQRQWAVLVTAWLTATRTPGLVGTRDAKGRALSALGPDLDRSLTPQVRRRALRLLGELPKGTAASEEDLLARLRWLRPLRPGADALRTDLLRWTLRDAETLGLTGRGALAAHARPLIAPAGPDGREHDASAAAEQAARLLAPLLPEPLDHVLLQADLTAVAPGPLISPLAETLGVLADVESKGGATVYRFTPDSVRRALDAGRTAAELRQFLTEHSRTPMPQPLSYLIDDVARKHGVLRVGAAAAYLRCDDDALLTELLADRRAAGLGLRRLAPTVVAAQADPATLLERLRAMGLAPAAESADGDVLITRPDARRTPPRTPPVPVTDGPPTPDTALLGLAVKAIRAGDRAATAVRRTPAPASPAADGLPRTSTAETLATVQAAALSGESLWIGYVNAEGAASQRVIAPVRVEGGYITAYDHTSDEVRTFALHRITGVSALADDPA
ncbi:helicase C-terminal domain-containing protein [Actinacidiphila acididurans]|uniref:Helicase C-terminal domain-containing protein n=1 Tax=Actinacidiphila acididurans TaxID=2784346 RepID=A0ABS2TPA7_9ACTN|nr:helicase C-terminal domain-containing protein [Actinacidiphila acididurans]MBM9505176.1 helicase C-terminal domain-containing protein [Actinacidiphila acididurans]